MPLFVRLLAILFVLYSLFMLFVLFTVVTMSEERIASMDAEGQALFQSIPTWNYLVGGTGAVLSLIDLTFFLLRKRGARLFLAIAVLCVMLRDSWFLWDGRILELASPASPLMSLMFFLVYLAQWLMALHATRKGWLA